MAPEPDDRATDGSVGAGQYFEASPQVASAPVVVEVNLPDTAFELETDRGVFSRGHLDVGTGLLLRSSPPIAPAGDLLDLGCGAGPIALTMARRAPAATVWAVDVNERARALTRSNAARNDVTNVQVVAPEQVPAGLRFATIWSNPPVRIGKAAMRSLVTGWLDRLADDGTATLVVQRHLGADSLHRWLVERGHPVERTGSKSGFRLLRVGPAVRVGASP